MTENSAEKAFVDRVRKALDLGTERLVPDLETRLNRARKEALASADPGQKRFRWWADWRIACAAAACGLMLAIGVLVYRPAEPPASVLLTDMAILTEAEDLELYENLEFYQWLSRVRENAG